MGIVDRIDRMLGRRGDAAPYAYPLDRTQERGYEGGFEGDVYVWDIDKTYLASEFDSIRGLLAIPLEMAVDKKNVAGTDVLLRALRRGRRDAEADTEAFRSNPLYFVSASPPQLRSVIQRKMLLDGVEYDGITFKDHVALVRSGRLGRVREQIGYKLSALLLNRRDVPWTVRETCFGDDTEADALVYSLYADVVAGRLRGDDLVRTLRKNGVEEEDADYAAGLSRDLPKADLVHRIYVNLERRTPPSHFQPFGPRLVPCYDTFQMALHLFEDGKLDRSAVLDVGRELLNAFQRQRLGLLRSAFDLLERDLLRAATLADLWEDLQRRHLLPAYVALDPSRAPFAPDPSSEPAARAAAGAAADLPRDFVTPASSLDLAP